MCAAAAAAASLYVLRLGLSPAGRPGCGAAGGCDAVLSSRWSRVGRVPVSVPAAGLYLGILALSLSSPAAGGPGTPQGAALAALALVAIGAAAWFAALQVLVVRRVCRFCMLTHALAVGAAAAALLASGAPPAAAWIAAALLVTVLLALQLWFPARTYAIDAPVRAPAGDPADPPAPQPSAAPVATPASPAAPPASPPPPARTVTLHGGKIVVNPADWPAAGDPAAARTVLAELFDYTCADCRHTYRLVHQAVRRYAPQLAVVLVPTPLDVRCNPAVRLQDPRHAGACEYARYALAVWRARPAAFAEYHDWLMGVPAVPPVLMAKSHAERLVGPSAFAAALRDPATDALIARAVDYYRAAGSGNLPRLALPSSVLWGRIPDAKTFFEVLEANAGPLVPSAAAVASPTQPRPGAV